MSKRALLLVNVNSKSGEANINSAVAVLGDAGIVLTTKTVDSTAELRELIVRNSQNVDFVVIGGGDGTMNAAAAALVETGLPLGIFPLGTANDLARTLKIPLALDEAAKVILQGRLHPIDLGTVNGHYFFNIANIGLGVQVKKNLSYEMKQQWGVLSYVRGFIKAIKTYRPFRAEIECDGHIHRVTSIQIAVGNGRHYGGGMTVSDAARIDDGLCFLYSVKPSSVWEIAKSAFAFRSGQFKGHHPVDIDHGARVKIKTNRSMSVSADGELITQTPAEFIVHKAAIRVFVPEAYLDQFLEPSRVDA